MSASLSSKKPRKVAHILLDFKAGGLENLVAMLVPQLAKDGLDCRVVCLHDRQDAHHRATVSRLRTAGIPVAVLNTPRGEAK